MEASIQSIYHEQINRIFMEGVIMISIRCRYVGSGYRHRLEYSIKFEYSCLLIEPFLSFEPASGSVVDPRPSPFIR